MRNVCRSCLSVISSVSMRSAIALNERPRLPISSLERGVARAASFPLPNRSTMAASCRTGRVIYAVTSQ